MLGVWKQVTLIAVFLLLGAELFGFRTYATLSTTSSLILPFDQLPELVHVAQGGHEVRITLDTLVPIQKEWIPRGASALRVLLVSLKNHTTTEDSITRLFDQVSGIPRSLVAEHVGDGVKYHTICVLNEIPTYASLQCMEDALRSEISATMVVPTKPRYAWLDMVNQSTMTVVHHATTSTDTATIAGAGAPSAPRPHNGEFLLNHVVLYISSQQRHGIGSLAGAIPSYASDISVILEKSPGDSSANHFMLPNGTTASAQVFFIKMYPLASVDVADSKSYTKQCHDTMLGADLLVCVGSMKCILPSLVLDGAATILAEPRHHAWLSSLQLSNTSKVRVVPLQAGPNATIPCHHTQGKFGSWHFNLSYHETHAYTDTKWIPASRAHLNDTQRHNKFVWDDEVCPVDLFSKAGFCKAMKDLGYQRLFAIGDSLQYMAMVSLSHMLGLPRIRVHSHARKKGGLLHYNEIIKCPAGFKFELAYYRSNHLWPVYGNGLSVSSSNGTSVDITRRQAAESRISREEDLQRDKTPKVYFICNGLRKSYYPDADGNCKWVYDYIEKDVPTLFWMGAGPHTHVLRMFSESLNNFGDFLRRYKRPNDMVMLRTLNAGHANCEKFINPFYSFQDYLEQGQTTLFDWNLYVKYNRLIEEQVWRISRDANWTGAKVSMHDIYWMTALRRDGHPTKTDCLHYLLPGAPDWWIHTLYSQLKDLAAEANSKES